MRLARTGVAFAGFSLGFMPGRQPREMSWKSCDTWAV